MTKKKRLAMLTAVMMLFAVIMPVFADTTASTTTSRGAIGTSTAGAGMASTAVIADNAGIEKNAKVTKEEAKKTAIEAAKKFFGLELDDKKYQSNIQLQPGMDFVRTYVWEISWNSYDGRTSSHISVGIDATTGKLIRFYKSMGYSSRDPVSVASITKEQAQKIADAFVQKTNPEQFKQTKLSDINSLYSSKIRPDYRFQYVREMNGIKYDANYIGVNIDGIDGSIRSYEYNWEEDLSFPGAEGIISKERAMELLKDKVDMKLCYLPIRSNIRPIVEQPTIKLVYQPDYQNGVFVDAKTAQLLDYNGKPLAEQKIRDITQAQKEKYLSDKKTSHQANDKEIDSDRATELINQQIKTLFGEGYRVENLNYSENESSFRVENSQTWSGEVIKFEGTGMNSVGYISINALTEELISFDKYDNGYDYGEAYEPKLTWEQAYDKAIELIGSHYPDKLAQLRTRQIFFPQTYLINGKEIPERRLYFHFPRIEKGIEYNDDYVSVGFDLKTGEVVNMAYNWSNNTSRPSAEGSIAKTSAKELYLKGFDGELKYLKVKKEAKTDNALYEIKVVYSLENKSPGLMSGIVDAFTGKSLNYSGEEVEGPESDFNSKIKGLPAEKELSILAFQGIIDTKDFNPDHDVTFIELIKMLVNAKNNRLTLSGSTEELLFKNITKKDDIYPYLQEAVKYGLIENKPVQLELQAKVSREQMVELIVKMMKYDKLAKAKDIFVLNFEDIGQMNPDKTGYFAIGKGLGIITGTDGKFRPKDNAKITEAAVGIYKALESLK